MTDDGKKPISIVYRTELSQRALRAIGEEALAGTSPATADQAVAWIDKIVTAAIESACADMDLHDEQDGKELLGDWD